MDGQKERTTDVGRVHVRTRSSDFRLNSVRALSSAVRIGHSYFVNEFFSLFLEEGRCSWTLSKPDELSNSPFVKWMGRKQFLIRQFLIMQIGHVNIQMLCSFVSLLGRGVHVCGKQI
jgi:hypothetical protein